MKKNMNMKEIYLFCWYREQNLDPNEKLQDIDLESLQETTF